MTFHNTLFWFLLERMSPKEEGAFWAPWICNAHWGGSDEPQDLLSGPGGQQAEGRGRELLAGGGTMGQCECAWGPAEVTVHQGCGGMFVQAGSHRVSRASLPWHICHHTWGRALGTLRMAGAELGSLPQSTWQGQLVSGFLVALDYPPSPPLLRSLPPPTVFKLSNLPFLSPQSFTVWETQLEQEWKWGTKV